MHVDECGANFSFISGRHDMAHDLGDSVDGSVESGHGGWVSAEVGWRGS